MTSNIRVGFIPLIDAAIPSLPGNAALPTRGLADRAGARNLLANIRDKLIHGLFDARTCWRLGGRHQSGGRKCQGPAGVPFGLNPTATASPWPRVSTAPWRNTGPPAAVPGNRRKHSSASSTGAKRRRSPRLPPCIPFSLSPSISAHGCG